MYALRLRIGMPVLGAWKSIVHHPGTLRIVVGRGWLIEQGLI
jgi:hypothetical protein